MTEHNHKAYTAADFERYYSGQMSDAEMHALEKSALDDPFLADALEGFSYTKTPINDVAELKEKLSKKKNKNQLFFLQNKVWLRVAASIILFAGIGYTIYELNSKKSFLAANEAKEILRANDSTFTTQNDSIKNKEAASTTNVLELKKEPSSDNENGYVQKQAMKKNEADSSATIAYNFSKSKNKNAIKNNETAFTTKVSELKNEQKLDSRKGYFETPVMKKFQVDSSKTTAYNFSMSENKNAKPENETHLLEGKLIDTAGKTLVIAGIKVSDKETIITDSLSRTKLNTKDSLQIADVAVTGYGRKQRDLARNVDQVKMMDSANQSLEEVVVTAGVNKKKNVEAPLTGKVTGISFNDPNYGPIGGWGKFDQYLSDNISIPVNKKGEKYNNTKVVISFEVDKNGEPQKVQIEQSLCNECDKEALRLLQSGPKWKYVSGKKYVIDVQF